MGCMDCQLRVYRQFEKDDDTSGNEPVGEEVTISVETVKELQQNLNNVNLKRFEEILAELCIGNFGQDVNKRLKDIKNDYDMFDYHKVKEELTDLISVLES